MSDKPEQVARVANEVEGSIEAPIIYFENAPTFGVGPGVGRVTLEMVIYDPTEGSEPPRARRRVVAHLRGPLAAFDALRSAINGMEAMITPPADTKPN